jgi:predicted RNase H-like HicB family nuclease
MARLILEDVTLNRDQTLIGVQVRFKGGATKSLSLPMPPNAWQLRKTKAEIVAEIDRLLERCTDSEIAAELNKKGNIVPPAFAACSDSHSGLALLGQLREPAVPYEDPPETTL